ncbi:MAG TPA: rhomboid family intramembrane serine protease [Bacteroidia bacterium]|nr:rhomboid family intramembrane serine protease [Bacteroidia bacterium]
MDEKVTYTIIAINCIVSFMGFSDRNFFEKYLYRPYNIHHNRGEWYRVFTSAFLHANVPHLFFNMFAFYSFGSILESQIFPGFFHEKALFYYILLYIGAIIVSAVPAFEKHKNTYAYAAVGASGAVSAVVFSFILIDPMAPLQLMFLPFNFTAWMFGGLYLIYSWYMSKHGHDNIGHDAHLWGGLFGVVFTLILHPAFAMAFVNQITGHSL